jgi:hypothetical protein
VIRDLSKNRATAKRIILKIATSSGARLGIVFEMDYSMNDPPLHNLGQSQDTPGATEHPLKYLLRHASGNMDMSI